LSWPPVQSEAMIRQFSQNMDGITVTNGCDNDIICMFALSIMLNICRRM